MYKIMKSAEEITNNIQLNFGDEYEVIVDNDYSSSVIIKSDTVYLNLIIYKHNDYNYDSISIANTNNNYATIKVMDYYGNKKSDISSNYINEIKDIIKSIKDRIDAYYQYVENVLTKLVEDSDGLCWNVNSKLHFFIRSKDSILRIKPRISVANNKTIFTITPVLSSYNEPVLEYDISENNDFEIFDDIMFFL